VQILRDGLILPKYYIILDVKHLGEGNTRSLELDGVLQDKLNHSELWTLFESADFDRLLIAWDLNLNLSGLDEIERDLIVLVEEDLSWR
jgi:hypothetical protein